MPINFPSNPNTNDTYTSGNTTWIYTGSVWDVVTSSAQVSVIRPDTFKTISVAGQNNVVADSDTDTLTLIAGSNVTITTDATNDAITINSTASGGGGGGDSFTTIAVAGQSSIVATSSTDTLNFANGSNISITTDPITNTLTIGATAGTQFSALTDALNASLTADKIYLPAITMLVVGNVGATSYTFDQYAGNNPTIYAVGAMTIAFNLQCPGHPFVIQDPAGNPYNTGLVHVSTTGSVSTGAAAQGQATGTLYWKIPASISGTYRYQCSLHPIMVGGISVKNIVSL